MWARVCDITATFTFQLLRLSFPPLLPFPVLLVVILHNFYYCYYCFYFCYDYMMFFQQCSAMHFSFMDLGHFFISIFYSSSSSNFYSSSSLSSSSYYASYNMKLYSTCSSFLFLYLPLPYLSSEIILPLTHFSSCYAFSKNWALTIHY